jgi:hypothetical protein
MGMSEATAEAQAKPSISFRVSKVMDRAQMTGARKHDMRLGPQPGYIDADKSAKNTALSLTDGYDLLKSAWSRRLDRDAAAMEARRIEDRKAKAMWRAGIITFSTEAQALLGDKSPEQEAKAAFEDFARRHGVRLLWAVGHHDESAVHFHAMFENIRDDGRCLRLNAKELSAEQDLVAKHFSKLGLVRGTKKADRIAAGEPISKTINRSVKQLHADLPAEIEAAQERLAKAQARADKAEANAKKYEGDADVALDRFNRYKVKVAEQEAKLAGLLKRQAAVEVRENAVAAKEQAVAQREAAVAGLPDLAREAMALLSGDETPARMDERHADERAASDDGVSTWEDNWTMYNPREPKGAPSYWQKLREHVIDFWREKIKNFGLKPSNDADFRPN